MKRIVSLLALVSCLFSGFAYSQTIGVVDLQKIMQTAPQMKVIQQRLEQNFKPRRDKLMAMEQGLKHDMETFKRDTTIMSPEKRKEMEKKIVSTQQLFEREGQQYQQELSTANSEAMEGLYTKIRAAIAKVAGDEHYDLVFQKDAAPFSVEKLDITMKVLKELNA